MSKQSEEFGHLCRKKRQDRGLTLREVSIACECSHSLISFLEQGILPSERILKRICTFFELDYDTAIHIRANVALNKIRKRYNLKGSE